MNSMAKYFTFLTIEKADSVLRKICKTYKRREKVKDMSRQKFNEYVTWKYLFKHVYLNNKSANKKMKTTFTIFCVYFLNNITFLCFSYLTK